jgi:alkylhydroperoxidase family enzyme
MPLPDRMFLPGVEDNPKPGPRKDFIDRMKAEKAEYPQLSHLFAFLPQATSHLSRFTQEIMRGESSVPAGMRELIAAYTSYENHCPF